MSDEQQLRTATATGYEVVSARPPNSYTWVPAIYCFTENNAQPVPVIVQLNPDGSVWADWDAVRRYCARFPLTAGQYQQGTDVLHLLLAMHDGRISDRPWREVCPFHGSVVKDWEASHD